MQSKLQLSLVNRALKGFVVDGELQAHLKSDNDRKPSGSDYKQLTLQSLPLSSSLQQLRIMYNRRSKLITIVSSEKQQKTPGKQCNSTS